MANDCAVAVPTGWAAFWRYVIERNPPHVHNAMPEFVPQTWAGMKRDCGR